ncbi:MAG: Nramp family divalent metal transporter [Phycisphaerae bacterium]|nr:Nramp family divalent metal transporter [Phycisphaerae bacterium]
MTESVDRQVSGKPRAWWCSIGPALITACMVFGPGSMLVSANVGATHGCELLWLLVLTGVLMGAFMIMAARIGVVGGASPCTLVARHLNRPAAAVIGLTLFLICATFQFGNNLAFAAAVGALISQPAPWAILILNLGLVLFLFKARNVYHLLERGMKIMVAMILICFVANLFAARPNVLSIVKGLVPHLPGEVSLRLPAKIDGGIHDPMLLIASLLGTTCSVGAALFQGNLVREKGWGLQEYRRGTTDAMAGVAVLTCTSAVIMITTATVIPGQVATDVGMLARSLQPLLGSLAFVMFYLGLLAVSLNPFVINAMIGGTILADGLGLPAGMGQRWPRHFTVLVLVIGMTVAMLALRTGQKPIKLIIMGQALTVFGNPLMAVTILWLANQRDIMGEHRNGWCANILGGLGLVLVVFIAIRVFCLVILHLT